MYLARIWGKALSTAPSSLEWMVSNNHTESNMWSYPRTPRPIKDREFRGLQVRWHWHPQQRLVSKVYLQDYYSQYHQTRRSSTQPLCSEVKEEVKYWIKVETGVRAKGGISIGYSPQDCIDKCVK